MLKKTAPPLLGWPGGELQALLWPVTPEEFVRDYWAKKPLFVKGFADKYRGLFDGAAFSRALSVTGAYHDDFLRASFDAKTERGTSKAPQNDESSSSVFRAGSDQAVPLFKAGATLCMSQVETRVPELARFLAAIKRQLGYPGKASFNAYLSPPGSGFNWHFDGRIASTLQIEGTKRWRFSGSTAIEWPRGNGTLGADGVARYTDPGVTAQAWERLAAFDEGDTTEVLLEPGDLLILPAGLWHEACGGDGGSLALNLSFTPLPYTVLVRQLLDVLLTPDPRWRSMAPALPGAACGDVDASALAAIGERLAHAGETLSRLGGDSAAVVRLWQALVQNPNPGGPSAPAAAAALPTLEPGQRLRVRADGEFTAMLADGGQRLCLAIGTNRSIEVDGEAVPFVRRLLAEGEFLACDCLGWSGDGTPFAWTDVELTLAQLLAQGLLEVVPAAA